MRHINPSLACKFLRKLVYHFFKRYKIQFMIWHDRLPNSLYINAIDDSGKSLKPHKDMPSKLPMEENREPDSPRLNFGLFKSKSF